MVDKDVPIRACSLNGNEKKLENVKNTATSRKLEEEKKTKISEFEAIGTNMSNS